MHLIKFHLESFLTTDRCFHCKLWKTLLSFYGKLFDLIPHRVQILILSTHGLLLLRHQKPHSQIGLAGSIILEAGVGNQLLRVLFRKVLVSVCIWKSCQFVVLLEPWAGSKRLFTVMNYYFYKYLPLILGNQYI